MTYHGSIWSFGLQLLCLHNSWKGTRGRHCGRQGHVWARDVVQEQPLRPSVAEALAADGDAHVALGAGIALVCDWVIG